MKKIKLLIVDDIEHVRQGLKTLLNLFEDIEIIGERRQATVLAEPAFDPANEALRA